MSDIFTDLENEGILKVDIKRPKGRGRAVHLCSLHETLDAFLKVAQFLREEDRIHIFPLDFLNTQYAQFMINEALLEYLGFGVADEYKAKLLLMLKLSPKIFFDIIDRFFGSKWYREVLLQEETEAEVDLLLTRFNSFSGTDIAAYEWLFFNDLIMMQFYLKRQKGGVYSQLPAEEIIETFDLKKDAGGRYMYTTTFTSTYYLAKRGRDECEEWYISM
jgi:hypothetical protein